MKYKSHIDGLRAFAVIPVVIFHLGSSWMPGGFIGVDVFFVISGFLIASILYEDMVNKRYSLLEFYKRRALRILPALTAVILVAAIVASLVLLPSERVELGKSIIATATFISNFYFWQDSSYFSAPAETKPLLHTWSLAVEEQFYILFPPVLFLIYKFFKSKLVWIIFGLSAVSLLSCVLLTKNHQSAAFYLLPSRAWELGMGALLAIIMKRNELPAWTKNISGLISFIGLLLVAVPVFILDKDSVFPGWVAVLPCLGSALLIGWAEYNYTGRVLSFPPFVWIGRISYSLYLWHWPVIVFWKLRYGDNLNNLDMLMLGVMSILLAVLSTYYIEKPFRNAFFRSMTPKRVVLGGGVILAGLVGIGLSSYYQMPSLRGYPGKTLAVSEVVNYRKTPDYDIQFRTGRCLIGQSAGSFEDFKQDECVSFDHSKKNVLLIGDSHAAQYWGALKELFPNVNIMQATSSGCRPLLDANGSKRCTDLRSWLFDDFIKNNKIDVVIVGGRWQVDEISLVRPTLQKLKKLTSKIILIGPTVEYQGVFPLLLARSLLNGRRFNFDDNLSEGRREMDDAMSREAKNANVKYLSVLSAECSGSNNCKLFASDGVPMQFDYGHLTLSGARDVVSTYYDIFSKEFN